MKISLKLRKNCKKQMGFKKKKVTGRKGGWGVGGGGGCKIKSNRATGNGKEKKKGRGGQSGTSLQVPGTDNAFVRKRGDPCRVARVGCFFLLYRIR